MNENTKARFLRILDGFRTAMLVTHAQDGGLRARPLVVLRTTQKGDIWFASPKGAPKLDEIAGDSRVCVSMQGGDRYLSLTGEAEVIDDPVRLRHLWREELAPYLPARDQVVLIKVTAHTGEYWDGTRAEPSEYRFAAARAPRGQPETVGNRKVDLD